MVTWAATWARIRSRVLGKFKLHAFYACHLFDPLCFFFLSLVELLYFDFIVHIFGIMEAMSFKYLYYFISKSGVI